MRTAPAVSVFMPTYNGEAFLAETLDSILSQTFRDLEVVVVDDCSTDGTWRLLRDYAARDDRLVLHRLDRNYGHAVASNRALALCRGRWLARHDQDDVSLPDRLERQIRLLESRPEVSLCATAYYRWDGSAERSPRCRGISHTEVRWRMLFENCLCHSSVVFPRSVLGPGEGYRDLPGPQDFDLWIRLATRGRVVVLGEPLVLYRVHDAGMTGKFEGRQADAVTLLSKAQLETLLPGRELSPELVRSLHGHHSPYRLARLEPEVARLFLRLFRVFAKQPGIDAAELDRLRARWLSWTLAASRRIDGWAGVLRILPLLAASEPLAVLRFGLFQLPGRLIGARLDNRREAA